MSPISEIRKIGGIKLSKKRNWFLKYVENI